MRTIFSFFFIGLFSLAFSQRYFSTTTSSLGSNVKIQHFGNIVLGDEYQDTHQFQVFKNSEAMVSTLFGNSLGRLNMGVAASPGQFSPWAKKGDATLRLLGGGDMHFHMPNNNMIDPNRDTSTPNSTGITRIRFSDVANKNTMVIFNTGKITMGTDLYDNSDYRLFVKDGIKTEKIKVEVGNTNGWADYVFKEDYNLMSLEKVEDHILKYGHLPNIPSAEKIVEDGGFELKEMNVKLLEKIEELTLHVIDLNKRIEFLESQNN